MAKLKEREAVNKSHLEIRTPCSAVSFRVFPIVNTVSVFLHQAVIYTRVISASKVGVSVWSGKRVL